jgi:hypothetical protein
LNHAASPTEPGSPGLFDHGITAGRIDEAIRQLQRIKKHTVGQRNSSDAETK